MAKCNNCFHVFGGLVINSMTKWLPSGDHALISGSSTCASSLKIGSTTGQNCEVPLVALVDRKHTFMLLLPVITLMAC